MKFLNLRLLVVFFTLILVPVNLINATVVYPDHPVWHEVEQKQVKSISTNAIEVINSSKAIKNPTQTPLFIVGEGYSSYMNFDFKKSMWTFALDSFRVGRDDDLSQDLPQHIRQQVPKDVDIYFILLNDKVLIPIDPMGAMQEMDNNPHDNEIKSIKEIAPSANSVEASSLNANVLASAEVKWEDRPSPPDPESYFWDIYEATKTIPAYYGNEPIEIEIEYTFLKDESFLKCGNFYACIKDYTEDVINFIATPLISSIDF